MFHILTVMWEPWLESTNTLNFTACDNFVPFGTEEKINSNMFSSSKTGFFRKIKPGFGKIKG